MPRTPTRPDVLLRPRPTRARSAGGLALTAVVLSLGACSGSVPGTQPDGAGAAATPAPSVGPTSSAAPAAGDPCGFVARADLEAALGSPLGPTRSTDDGLTRSCDYLTGGPSDVTLLLRQRLRVTATEFATGRSQVAVGREAPAVVGLGDEAYSADLPGGTRLVVARSGERELLVSTTGSVSAAQALAVARLGLARLVAQPG